ncbi:MAG: hypothetical protein Q9194_003688 [Teloschistes cf. exilis]
MDGSQSPTPTLDFPMTLEDAYKEIDVTDHDMSDGDVVLHEIVKPRWTFKALVIIARHRRSKLLEFILTIIPHLTKDNVRLLVATPPSSPQATGLLSRRFWFELEPSEKAFITIDDDDRASAAETANNQPSPANWPDSLASSQLACGDPNSDPVSSSDDGIILTHDAASPYTYTSPSSDDSLLDSDCGQPIGGKYFNGNYWVCQECDDEFSEDELEDGKCPCGHIICFATQRPSIPKQMSVPANLLLMTMVKALETNQGWLGIAWMACGGAQIVPGRWKLTTKMKDTVTAVWPSQLRTGTPLGGVGRFGVRQRGRSIRRGRWPCVLVENIDHTID